MYRQATSVDDFLKILDAIVDTVKVMASIPNFSEAGWNPTGDLEFWAIIDKIRETGISRDQSQAMWLANLTQVDALGPMGRALFLSRAALAALSTMPETALSVARRISKTFAEDTSAYRKMGLMMIYQVSGEIAEELVDFLTDDNLQIRPYAERIIDEMKQNLSPFSVNGHRFPEVF